MKQRLGSDAEDRSRAGSGRSQLTQKLTQKLTHRSAKRVPSPLPLEAALVVQVDPYLASLLIRHVIDRTRGQGRTQTTRARPAPSPPRPSNTARPTARSRSSAPTPPAGRRPSPAPPSRPAPAPRGSLGREIFNSVVLRPPSGFATWVLQPGNAQLLARLRVNPTVRDVERSAVTGGLRGVLGSRNASGELLSLINQGVGLVARRSRIASDEESRRLTQRLESARRLVPPIMPGQVFSTYDEDVSRQPAPVRQVLQHRPQTEVGRWSQVGAAATSGAFVPFMGWRGALGAAGSAASAEAAGQVTRLIDPELEPYVRLISGVLSPRVRRPGSRRPVHNDPLETPPRQTEIVGTPPEGLDASMASMIGQFRSSGRHSAFPRRAPSEGAQRQRNEGVSEIRPTASAGGQTSGSPAPREYPEGSFSILDWSKYPVIPARRALPGHPVLRQPAGPFRRQSGAELSNNRSAGRRAARSYRRRYLRGQGRGVTAAFDVHHIQPIFLDGPPDLDANMMPLDRAFHQGPVRAFYQPFYAMRAVTHPDPPRAR